MAGGAPGAGPVPPGGHGTAGRPAPTGGNCPCLAQMAGAQHTCSVSCAGHNAVHGVDRGRVRCVVGQGMARALHVQARCGLPVARWLQTTSSCCAGEAQDGARTASKVVGRARGTNGRRGPAVGRRTQYSTHYVHYAGHMCCQCQMLDRVLRTWWGVHPATAPLLGAGGPLPTPVHPRCLWPRAPWHACTWMPQGHIGAEGVSAVRANADQGR